MIKRILVICATSLLFGCIDGGNDDTDKKAGESEINALIEKSNTPTYVNLYNVDTSQPFEKKGLVRFDTTSPIQLYYVSANGSKPPQAIVDGIAALESRLGDIFTDFTPLTAELSSYRDTSYPTENRGNGSFDAKTFNATQGIHSGIVFSIGTAYYSSQYSDSPQNMCANASSAPYDGGLSIGIETNTHLYAANTVVWVNMGNGQCSWDKKMVMHETSHNMGMFNHIEPYFGLWSETAMNMLATIYNNAGGTAFADLNVDYK